MEMPDRLGDGTEIGAGEPLRKFGVVERLLVDGGEDFVRQRGNRTRIPRSTPLVRLALDVVVDSRALRIGVGDALVMLLGDALRNGGVDADLGAGRHHAKSLRQARS